MTPCPHRMLRPWTDKLANFWIWIFTKRINALTTAKTTTKSVVRISTILQKTVVVTWELIGPRFVTTFEERNNVQIRTLAYTRTITLKSFTTRKSTKPSFVRVSLLAWEPASTVNTARLLTVRMKSRLTWSTNLSGMKTSTYSTSRQFGVPTANKFTSAMPVCTRTTGKTTDASRSIISLSPQCVRIGTKNQQSTSTLTPAPTAFSAKSPTDGKKTCFIQTYTKSIGAQLIKSVKTNTALTSTTKKRNDSLCLSGLDTSRGVGPSSFQQLTTANHCLNSESLNAVWVQSNRHHFRHLLKKYGLGNKAPTWIALNWSQLSYRRARSIINRYSTSLSSRSHR